MNIQLCRPLPLVRVSLMPCVWNGVEWVPVSDPCDEWAHVHPRPAAPVGDDRIWYRGWEVGFDYDAEFWVGQGWRGYRGGCDLNAPEVMASTYAACLDEIDMEEGG